MSAEVPSSNRFSDAILSHNEVKPPRLSLQQSDQPITCTANALINALTLRGAIVNSEQSQILIQKTLAKIAPLTPEEKKTFAAAYGFEIRPWRLSAMQITDPESIATQFAQHLQDAGPAMITIASPLSKRNRSIMPSITFDANPELIGNGVSHRVVADSNGNTVRIIDSYDP